MSRTAATKIIRILLPIVIIVAAFAVMKSMVAKRPAPRKVARTDPGVLVHVVKAKKETLRVGVKGTGTVRAEREVSIVPQVSGLVTEVSPSLVTGGFVKEGEVLFKIDDSDYLLALERAEATRVKAAYEFTVMESRAEVARSEWERLRKDDAGEPNPLVVFEPQLKRARAEVNSADAELKRARLDLKRTEVVVPFNSRVSMEEVEVGRYVSAGAAVAELSGTDFAEVAVPLPPEELRWLSVPRAGSGGGSRAAVSFGIGGAAREWQGRIVRSTGEIDPADRMIEVIVRVADPYGLLKPEAKGAELAEGAFVIVEFAGKRLKDVFEIPRTALREGSTVWTVDEDGKLRIKKVEVIRLGRDTVVVDKGLAAGDSVVLTNITGVAEGMKLRVKEAD